MCVGAGAAGKVGGGPGARRQPHMAHKIFFKDTEGFNITLRIQRQHKANMLLCYNDKVIQNINSTVY